MTLVWPLALLGLLGVPLLILLERRRRRPRDRVWPSLLLWRAVEAVDAPKRRRVEPLLLYECGALILLVLAASGPALRVGGGEKKVVALIDHGRHMMARLRDGRTALAATYEELNRIDADVHRVRVEGDLVAKATEIGKGDAVVLATSLPGVEGPGYLVVGRAPEGDNVGIDAVVVDGDRLWFALATDGEPREVDVEVGGRRLRARTGAGVETEFASEIRIVGANDNYDGDNRCSLRRLSVVVRTDSESPFLLQAIAVGIPAAATAGEPDLVIDTQGGEPVAGPVRGADCVVAPGIFEGLLLDECVWSGARTREGPGLLAWRGRALAKWLDRKTLWLGLPLDRDWDERGTLAVLVHAAKRARVPLAENERIVGDAVASPAPGLVWTKGVDRPFEGPLPEGATLPGKRRDLRWILAALGAVVLLFYLRAIVHRS